MIKIIRFKIDVIEELKKVGVTSVTIKENKLFAAGTMKKFKDSNMSLQLEVIDRLCHVLNMDIGDILEHVK